MADRIGSCDLFLDISHGLEIKIRAIVLDRSMKVGDSPRVLPPNRFLFVITDTITEHDPPFCSIV